MKFLFDENFPFGPWGRVANLFGSHHFGRVGSDIEAGITDLEVFQQATADQYEVFVTGDIKQLFIPTERKACREAGLHWIGVPMNPKSKGKSIAHGQVGKLLASMRLVVDHLEDSSTPQALLLNPAGHLIDLQKGYPQAL